MNNEIQQLKRKLMKNEVIRHVYRAKMSDVIYRTSRMIKEARVSAGLSQIELANKLGTKQSAIARIENGKANPNLKTLIKIAEALDTKLLPVKFESMEWIENNYDEELKNLTNFRADTPLFGNDTKFYVANVLTTPQVMNFEIRTPSTI